tara:strand:+ start:913 stop:1287 length:375 start_codon:yes stop_codon:yes gene_type:complete
MAFAIGKFAKAVSDRSGLAFPYNEMVKEWNGSLVHYSEFEEKHPQLDPKKHKTDPEALKNATPEFKLYGSDQLYNGSISTLEQALGIKASEKRIRGSFTLATGNTLATALTSTAALGSITISVS